MTTLRDDLGRIGRRLVETLEERTGREIVPAEKLRLLESAESDARIMRKTLDLIGFQLFNYQGQTPFEMQPQLRWYSYTQALRAWCEDPLAGEAVDLYLSFVFGRGVPRPIAHDDEVQDRLDETWNDPANQRIFTSYPKLLEKGIDVCLQSEVFFTFNDEGEDGRVVASMLRFQDVQEPVRHPKDRFRILFYRVVEKTYTYSYTNFGLNTGATEEATQPQSVFYEVLDAFDDDNPAMAAQDRDLERPPASMLRPGKIYPLQVNKTSEMGHAVPRMRRLLRWYSAYNEMIEAHVNRMKAMASVYMKASARGDQGQLNKLAMMARQRTSAFSETDRDAAELGGRRVLSGMEGVAPDGPGILTENESLNWQPFKIDSGAGDVSTAAPIVRGQAGGPWPDHYLSGSATGTVQGTQAMELPVLKFVEMEQEMWAGMMRRFGRLAIDRAVEIGDITEWRDPTEDELERIQAFEELGTPLDGLEYDKQRGKVKRDLGFDLSLPSPLKRAMGDLVTAAIEVAQEIDRDGTNPEMKRWLFAFCLAEAFDVEDPMRIVDQVLPRRPADEQDDTATGDTVDPAAAGPGQLPLPLGPDGRRHPPDNPYGARRSAPDPEDRPLTETPATASAAPPAHGNGHLEGAAAAVAAAVRRALRVHQSRVLGQFTPRMQRALTAFLLAQRTRLLAVAAEHGELLEKSPDPLAVIWDQAAEDRALLDAYLPVVDEIAVATLNAASGIPALDLAWNLEHPLVAKAREQLASRVTQVNETTRTQLAKVIDDGLRAGYTPAQIAHGVLADGYGGIDGMYDASLADRAELIASTETANAYNMASLASYADAGVQLVEVSDGDGCEICAITDGAIWTVDQAASDPLQHPNCVRAFAPALATADNLAMAEAALLEAPKQTRQFYGPAAGSPAGKRDREARDAG